MADTGRRMGDRELEEYRSLMEVPSAFVDGFNLRSLIGAVFIGLVMVPAAMYIGLLAGQGIGPAAQWVTVILFIEAARRAHQALNKGELFVLFYLAGAVMATPFSGLLWNQFFVQSSAAKAAGIAEHLPAWFAPSDPDVLGRRTFFCQPWLPAMALVVFTLVMGRLNQLILGYGLFHLTSDIEQLPFPMAPAGAQGIMALADEAQEQQARERHAGAPPAPPEEEGLAAAPPEDRTWRWRVFTIGAGIGMLFGILYLGLPTISGAFLKQPLMIFPIPFVDWTAKTGPYLPAVATGMCFDAGQFLLGMVMPFSAILGSLFGLLATCIINPMLYHFGRLPSWSPGDGTIPTLFETRIDFYFSFSIGLALAIAVVGVWQVLRALRRARCEREARGVVRQRTLTEALLRQRGDIRMIWVVLAYVVTTASYILVSGWLLHWHRGALIAFTIIGFGYAPLMTYVRTRLEGMVGQTVSVPMIMEAARIFSGYRGAEIWFVPMPQAEIETFAVSYRQAELTGTSFRSIWKAQIFLMPIIIGGSVFFANFIWSMAPIPSPRFPFTEQMWEFNALNNCIMYSSTMGGYSQFEQAFRPALVALGTGVGLALFGAFSWIGLPAMFIYGAIRGLDQTWPHTVVPQFLGALLGHYYFRKRFKDRWLAYITVVFAGFSCGAGLITVLGIGFTFLKNAVIQLPF